jgi:hypothetical protein
MVSRVASVRAKGAENILRVIFRWRDIVGLFTVAILGPFSGHFQTHFRVIFEYLAEKQTKGS